MPDLRPVDHDPFVGPVLNPVDHDPWASPMTGAQQWESAIAANAQRQARAPSTGQQILDIVGGAGQALAAPLLAGPKLMADVASGAVDPNSPEAIRRSTDVALNTAGMGMLGAERGAVGALGGKGNLGQNVRPSLDAQPKLTTPEVSARIAPEGAMSTGKINRGTIEQFLKENGIEFSKEYSASLSDRHGPSSSVYYKIKTPDGEKTVRVSDHSYGDKQFDFRFGHDAAPAFEKILKATGRDVPSDIAQQSAAAQLIKARDALAYAKKAKYPDAITHWQSEIDRLSSLASTQVASTRAQGGYSLNRTRMEPGEGSRGARHEFEINGPEGSVAGRLKIRDKGDRLYVDNIESEGIGAADARDLARQLKEHFPAAQTVSGLRTRAGEMRTQVVPLRTIPVDHDPFAGQ